MARKVQTVRTGKFTSNITNTNTVRRGFGLMFRVVELIRTGMIETLTGVSRRASLAGNGFQPLEPRRLFNATLAANQFTMVEGPVVNGVASGVVMLANGTTAGVTAVVATVNGTGVADTVSGITIDLNNAAPGTTTTIRLSSSLDVSGLITFTNYQPGAVVNLTMDLEQLNDNAGAGSYTPIGASSGFTAANYIADTNNGSTNPNTDTDNDVNFAPAANAGFHGVTFNTALSAAGAGNSGSNIFIRNFAAAGGAIGTVTVPGATVGTTSTLLLFRGAASPSVGNLLFNGAGAFQIVTEGNESLGAVSFGTVNYTNGGTGGIVVQPAGTGDIGAVTIGAVSSTETATGGITLNGRNIASVSVGAVSVQANASSTIAIANTGTVGAVTFTSLAAAGNGALTVNVGGTTLASLTVTSGINFSTTNASILNVPSTGDVGAVTIGGVTVQGTGNQNYTAVNVAPGGAIGAVSTGAVTLGDNGDNDGVTLNFLAGGVNKAIGTITTGAVVALGNGTSALNFDSSGTGTVGSATFGAMTVGAGTALNVSVGHSTATGSPGLNLAGATVGTAVTGGNLTVGLAAAATGTTTITGLWSIFGTANLNLVASGVTGATLGAGALNGAAWNIDVQQNSTMNITDSAVDGVAQITINSVDLISDNTGSNRGILNLTSAADSNNDGTGAFTGLTVSTAGDDFSGEVPSSNDPGGFQRVITSANITGISAGNFSIAGGVGDVTGGNGSFTVNVTGFGSTDSAIGSVTLGAGNTRNSNSDGVVLTANAGIGAITVLGSDSTLLNANVNANADTNIAGPLGSVSVTGSGGAASLTGNGFFASNIPSITLGNGNLNLSNVVINTGGALQTARNTTNNAIGNLTVTMGTMTINTITSDDGVGAISVDPARASAATVNIGTITTDNDAVTGAANTASVGGGLASITAGGTITVNNIDSNQLNLTTVQTGTLVGPIVSNLGSVAINGTLDSGNDIGSVAAAGSVFINNLTVSGNVPSITSTGRLAGTAETIQINNMTVQGNVDTIASGLGNAGGFDDSVTLNGGTIFGGLNIVNAGAGTLTINGLNVKADVGTNGPLYILTGSNVAYLVDVRGTGTNATFDTTLTINSLGTSSVAINDIEGTTSFANTNLSIVTRSATTANAIAGFVAGLGVDDSANVFNLSSLQDDFGGTQVGRHDFHTILIEGSLNGDIGGLFDPALLGAGAANIRNSVSPNAAVLGNIGSIVINGNWDIASQGGASHIYALRLDSISYGSTTNNGTPTQDIGVNNNGTAEDLEIFNSLTPVSQDIAVTPTDGGTITTLFAGPGGTFETIRTTDNATDGVIDTVLYRFNTGVISEIYTFGQRIGIEYNAVNAAAPGTSSTTNIFYGVSQGAFTFTNVVTTGVDTNTTGAINAIDYLDFSSSIGNVTVVDADLASTPLINEASDALVPGLGNVFVGFTVSENSASDFTGTLSDYIGAKGDGSGPSGALLRFTTSAATGTVVRGTIGNFVVAGPIGAIVNSGNVGSITTSDSSVAARAALGLNVGAQLGIQVGIANLAGLVTDGTVGNIDITGSVTGSLVVGDTTLISRGPDNILGNADDVVGFTGDATTAFFGTNITVTGGNLGSTPSDVAGTVVPVITGNEVSAPFGINTAILVKPLPNLTAVDLNNAAGLEGRLLAAIVSGKQTAFPPTGSTAATVNQESDSIAGSITAVDIVGDIWSGKSISAPITATSLAPFATPAALTATAGTAASPVTGTGQGSGFIGSEGGNTRLLIIATGGSPGDITGDITSAGSMVNMDIQAGTGSGGSILANIIAGTDGSGGVTNSTILADDDLGSSPSTNVVSSADSATWTSVVVGAQTVASVGDPIDGGDLNSDFSAGVLVNLASPTTTVPVTTNFNDSNLPLFGVSVGGTTSTASLTIGTLTVGIIGGTAPQFLNSDINGTFVAGLNVTISGMTVNGDAVGNDGVVGGHLAAAGLGNIGANTATLSIGNSTIVGNLGGELTAGTFYDSVTGTTLATSPFNSNDILIVPGTVLTLGNVAVGTLTVGTWDLLATGPTLDGILAGTSPTTVSSIVPNFAVGATGNAAATITAVGLPFSGTQTGPGSVTADPATGNINGVAVAAFGTTSGTLTARNSANIAFIISNFDALTAFAVNGTDSPSNPATNNPLNSGAAANNSVNVVANGNGTGGLTVAYDLAAFDPIAVRTAGIASFYNGFGQGALTGNLTSNDAHPENGFAAGILNIGLFAAGGNVSGSLIADGNINGTAGAGDSVTFFPGGQDADVVAGLSAIAKAAGLNATNNAGFFGGGNVSGNIQAGGRIGAADARFNIAALAGTGGTVVGTATNGNFSGTLVSGTRDQFGVNADVNSDINALVIAANNISGTIDAGDFGNVSGNGSGLQGGSFIGGLIDGAGNDLDINADADNILAANNSATIRTAGNLDVTGFGILSENGITGSIAVGYGATGGNLLGNVIAEGDINEIQVWGNVGTAATPSLIYAGGVITRLIVGNSPFAATTGLTGTRLRASSFYTGGFGTLNAQVFEGGQSGNTTTQILVGGAISPVSNLVLGAQDGITGATISSNGNQQVVTIGNGGRALITVSGADIAALGTIGNPGTNSNAASPSLGAVDVIVRGAGATISSTNTGTGPLGLRDILASDTLGSVTVNDGSVRSIVANDDEDGQALLAAKVAVLGTAPSSFSFLANSLQVVGLMAQSFNNEGALIGITGPITVDFNIGTTATGVSVPGTPGVGLNDALSNFAIFAQGPISGAITSNSGSIGNIVAGTTFSSNVSAYGSIGSVYATTGGMTSNSFTASTGSIGVISAQLNLDGLVINAQAGSLGGLQSRNGLIRGNTAFVHNNIGLIEASGDIFNNTFTAETGDVGIDLDTVDFFDAITTPITNTTTGNNIGTNTFGIYSDAGSIVRLSVTAGRNIGGLYAPVGAISGHVMDVATSDVNLVPRYKPAVTSGSFVSSGGDNFTDSTVITYTSTTGNLFVSAVDSQLIAGGSIGSLVAQADISNFIIRASGNVGNITSLTGRIGGTNNLLLNGPTGTTTLDPARIEQGVLFVVARGSVGDLDALLDVGTNPVPTFFGSVSGGVSVYANANQVIDPVTLQYKVIPADPTLSTGIGNVFSHLGNVNGTFITSGNIGHVGDGTNAPTGTHTGGIAAPLGTVNATIVAGGIVSGVGSGTNGSSGSTTPAGTYTGTASPNNPLVVQLGGVAYVVNVTNATANVGYTVAGGTITFNTISLTTTGPGAGVQVFSTVGDRGTVLTALNSTNAASFANLNALSAATTTVTSLTSAGNLSNVLIEGDLGSASISGNLVGGTVSVTGSVGSINATGNIGSATSTTNPFVAADEAFVFGSSRVGSITAGGTNFGLTAPITIKNGQYLSWANTATTGVGANFITAYVRKGTAVLTLNNGFLQNVNLGTGSIDGLLVFASATTFDTATDLTPANPKANVDNDKVLAAYALGKALPKGTDRPAFKADSGANVANVGSITSNGLSRVSLTNLVVEGSVGELALSRAVRGDMPSAGFTANTSKVTIYGTLETGSVAGTASETQLLGNVGVFTAATIRNLLITDTVDVLAASKSIDGARISGNAGSISSGGTLNAVRVDGSAIQVSARSASNLVVAGSIGYSVTTDGSGGIIATSLGSAFSQGTVASVLGINPANFIASGNPGPVFSTVTGTGVISTTVTTTGSTVSYYGGLFVSDVAKQVSVGGVISDLFLGKIVNTNGQNLFGQTVDDVYIGVAKNKFFKKTNGVSIQDA